MTDRTFVSTEMVPEEVDDLHWQAFSVILFTQYGKLFADSGPIPTTTGNVKKAGTPMVKLLMTWDIKKNKEPAYFEFIMKEFTPRLMKLGLQPSEAWYTVYGSGPQILTGGVTENMQKMREILTSDEWKELKGQLLTYVTNFQQKVLPATGRFQL